MLVLIGGGGGGEAFGKARGRLELPRVEAEEEQLAGLEHLLELEVARLAELGEEEVDERLGDGRIVERRLADVRLDRRGRRVVAARRVLAPTARVVAHEHALAQQLEEEEVDVLGVGVLLFAYQAEQRLHVEHGEQDSVELRICVRLVLFDVLLCRCCC